MCGSTLEWVPRFPTPPHPGVREGSGLPKVDSNIFPHGLTYNCDGGFKVAISGNMGSFHQESPSAPGYCHQQLLEGLNRKIFRLVAENAKDVHEITEDLNVCLLAL